MNMTEQKSKGRRGFFAAFGALAAVGVAAKLATPSNPDPAASADASAQGSGYRLSEHIKKYYRSTTI
jgi:hypothetical protein